MRTLSRFIQYPTMNICVRFAVSYFEVWIFWVKSPKYLIFSHFSTRLPSNQALLVYFITLTKAVLINNFQGVSV